MASKLAICLKILGGLAFATFVANCSSSLASEAAPAGDGPCVGCGGIDGSAPDQYVHEAGPDVPNDVDGAQSVNPLCGKGCIPDQKQGCADHDAGRPDAGSPIVDASDDRLEGSTPDAKPANYACYVTRVGSGPAATCEVAGSGKAEDPCLSSSDCAPGLGCVGDGAAAQCRPFCCTGGDVCESDATGEKSTYCAERPLREQPASYAIGAALSVPVCVVADNCDLAQPYPCPADAVSDGRCTCKDEKTACMVARADGTTSCMVPDKGQVGDACPCAWGHICSRSTGKCVKICTVDRECARGTCQGGSANLPPNFGVCVGDMSADAR